MTYTIQVPLGIVAPDPELLAKSKNAPGACHLSVMRSISLLRMSATQIAAQPTEHHSHLKTLIAKVKSHAINAIRRTDARPF